MHKAAVRRNLDVVLHAAETRCDIDVEQPITELMQSLASVPLTDDLAVQQFGEVMIARWLEVSFRKTLSWPGQRHCRVFYGLRQSEPQKGQDNPMVGLEQSTGCFAVIVPDHLWGASQLAERDVLLPTDSALVRIATDFIAALWSRGHELDDSQRSLMQWQVVEMMRACWVPLKKTAESARGRVTIEDVQAYISRHLSDVELTPASIASALGVSVRYLHKIMRHSGQTLCRHILDMRLEKSRSFLVHPILRQETVTDIALRSGFNSMTHFSRVFRERYGVSPSQFRKTLTV